MTLAAATAFRLDLVGGRGFVCLAIAAAAAWRPGLAVVAVLPLGAIEAMRANLPAELAGSVQADLLAILPHVLALVALVAAGVRPRALAALGLAFPRVRDAGRSF
jgi:simple sugar transport system permease protein